MTLTIRGAVKRMVACVAAAAVLVGLAIAGAPASPSQAASPELQKASLTGVSTASAIVGSDFSPGYIIADELFYDTGAMTAAEIQAFLTSHISGACTNGKCLTVGRFAVDSRPISYSDTTGNVRCQAFAGGTDLSAAEIIYRAQVACGISARVILVTLQKEQGLISKTAPSDSALIHAMGMACPDTSPCQSYAEGFGNQIYLGARQLMTYKASRFATQPGYRSIGFHPNSACGSTVINIQNYATAALYAYTPYQPNGAALANLRGTGDSCSSYGNRNFWVYYNDWFGSTIGSPPTVAANATIGEPDQYVFARDFSGALWIYPSDGHTGWLAPGQVGANWGTMNVMFSAGDFDGDGHEDVIARDGFGGLWIYPRDGSGGWLTRQKIGGGWTAFNSIFPVGDFTGDGNIDVMGTTLSGDLYLYPGNGHGGWLAASRIGTGWNIFTSVLGGGDFTGDGRQDVLATDRNGDMWVYPGGGGANWGPRVKVSGGWTAYANVFTGGDLNADGKTDVLARDSLGGLFFFPADGAGHLGAVSQIGSGWDAFSVVSAAGNLGTPSVPPVARPSEPGMGDFDGDGMRDIMVRSTSGRLWLYRGTATGGFFQPKAVGDGWEGFTSITPTGDFNGDRKPDVVARDAAGTLWLYPGTGTGTFAVPLQVATGWGAYNLILSPGDFNGDGFTDLLTRTSTGDLLMFPGNGAGAIGASVRIGAGWQVFNAIFPGGDVNGDGKQDLFAREANGNLWLYPGNGAGGWGSYFRIGAGWQMFDMLVGTGDFDGDGKPDVVAREPNGKLWLYPTTGANGWKHYYVIGGGWTMFNWIG